MTAEKAIRCIQALESLQELMELYDEYCDDNEVPEAPARVKKKKVLVKSNDIQEKLLKDITWKHETDEDMFCPMSMDQFEEILAMLEPRLSKCDDGVKYTFSFRIRLAVTLRFLIAGDSYRSLEALSHLSRTTICKFVPQTLKLLISVLESEYIKIPMTETDWCDISNDFFYFWQFPHTLGVIDGKYISTRAPMRNQAGSSFSSLILLSVIDPHGRFLHIDTINGDNMKPVNAYKNSNFYQALTTKTLNIPTEEPLEGQNEDTNYYFIGDEIFKMDRYFLKDYDNNCNLNSQQRSFNYRIRRARLPAHMAFELLFYRFRIFNRTQDLDFKNCDLVIRACCILHNYLTQNLLEIQDIGENTIPLNLPDTIIQIPKQNYDDYSSDASQMRDNVSRYCENEGEFFADIPEEWIKSEI